MQEDKTLGESDAVSDLSKDNFLELTRLANFVRRTVLNEMAVPAQSGHVTTAFSLTELLLALYHGILRFDPTDLTWPDRDRFILSEGQAGIGLYPVLALAGFFPLAELRNFVQEGSRLGVHAEPGVPGVQVLTGSLGHGLPIATGMADAAKMNSALHLVFCLTGDGELCEGSNFEAMITVGTYELNNLVLIVNRNHQFTIGRTDGNETQRDVQLDPLPAKFEAFGFETRVINGHSFSEIFAAFADVRARVEVGAPPLCIIAETVKGYKGGPLLENQRMWHYRVPSGGDLANVRATLDAEANYLALEAE